MDRFKVLCLTVLCSVVEAGEIPSGHLYMFLMGQGIGIDEHSAIVGTLERAGWVTNRSHLLQPTVKGREVAAKVEATLKKAKA